MRRWTRTTRTFGRTRALSRHRRGPRRRARDRGRRRLGARARVRDAARRLLRRDDPGAGARVPPGRARSAGRLRDEGVPERRGHAAPRRGGNRRGRVHARGAAVRPRPRQFRPSGSSCTATTSRTRSCAARRRRAGVRGLDSVEELERARAAGVTHARAHYPGIEADDARSDPHGHVGSKFGMAPEEAARHPRRARRLHVHIGSQLLSTAGARQTLEWLNRFLAERGWGPDVVDSAAASAFPTHPSESARLDRGARRACCHEGWETNARADPRARPFARRTGGSDALPRRLGQARGREDWAAVDGGLSDNPRPQLYGARYTAVLADRAARPPALTSSAIAGLHCESGDVLIDAVELAGAPPRRPPGGSGDRGVHARRWARTTTPSRGRLLCSSRAGTPRLIRRRETLEGSTGARARVDARARGQQKRRLCPPRLAGGSPRRAARRTNRRRGPPRASRLRIADRSCRQRVYEADAPTKPGRTS